MFHQDKVMPESQARQRSGSDWGVYEIPDVVTESWGISDDCGSLWAPPQPRRATYDESDYNQYAATSRRPAWKCKHCGGVAWCEEDPCEGCGRFLQTANAQPLARPGDWQCTGCANTNWEWRTQCNRCHTCRDGVVDDLVKQRLKKRLSTHPAGVFKDNDWVCVCCGNINWDWRSKCHQCATHKPVAARKSNRSRQQSS